MVAPPPPPAAGRARWRNAIWAAVVVAMGAGLALGAGALGGGAAKPPSLYQRALAVTGEYRCPVCAGESVAASDAPAALEIKALVQRWLGEGLSPAEIRSYLVKDYGPSVLERPPTSGVSVLVWALPGVAAAAGVFGLGFGFARWRRANAVVGLPAGGLPAGLGPEEGPGPGLVRGPEDSPVTRAMKPAPALAWRLALAAGLALVVVAASLWAVDRAASPRLPGSTATGGPEGASAELQQASALAATDPAAALAVYDAVLSIQPDQPEALTDEGWIYAQGGFVDQAMAKLGKAEEVDPAYAPAHFYRALVLLDDENDPGPAVAELKWFLAHGPAPALVAAAKAALAVAEAKKPQD
jgi:cytochrome c-type biogenesis protein CcmH